jgi:hypothetical protein
MLTARGYFLQTQYVSQNLQVQTWSLKEKRPRTQAGLFLVPQAPVIRRKQMPQWNTRLKQLGVVLVGAALAWLVLWA